MQLSASTVMSPLDFGGSRKPGSPQLHMSTSGNKDGLTPQAYLGDHASPNYDATGHPSSKHSASTEMFPLEEAQRLAPRDFTCQCLIIVRATT